MEETIGDRIRKVRRESSLRQEDFAKAIGIARAYLSQLEANKRQPGRDIIIKISKEFNKSLNWLLKGDNTNDSIPTNNEDEVLLLQAFRQLPVKEAEMHLELILQRVESKK